MKELQERIKKFWEKVDDFKKRYPRGTKITDDVLQEDMLIKQEYEAIMSELMFRRVFNIKE